jgi:hypothetical protein
MDTRNQSLHGAGEDGVKQSKAYCGVLGAYGLELDPALS